MQTNSTTERRPPVTTQSLMAKIAMPFYLVGIPKLNFGTVGSNDACLQGGA